MASVSAEGSEANKQTVSLKDRRQDSRLGDSRLSTSSQIRFTDPPLTRFRPQR